MGQTNVNVPGSNNSSGMGAGMIVGLVLAIVVIGFVVWYFAFKGGSGTPTQSGAPTQSVPASVGGSTAPSALVPLFFA